MTEREYGTSLPWPPGWDALPLGGRLLAIVSSLLNLFVLVSFATFAAEGR